uniref:RING-type E3 ubiquitin transferase n=1 Tax=Aegilops tauschii subsp. strangulata TaxID=200361 RepID=A0A452YNL1_AEGTS
TPPAPPPCSGPGKNLRPQNARREDDPPPAPAPKLRPHASPPAIPPTVGSPAPRSPLRRARAHEDAARRCGRARRAAMGNSLGCSASGERLVSAARDGDAVEARMLLELSPALARYSTFGGLNSPLHFAAAKGHLDIVTLLLEKGADVNARNYCGQTALMHACRHGHWEVVQMLLLFRCNVTRADYLSGRTALHFAAHDGLVRCVRLLLADFIPSGPLEDTASSVADGGDSQMNSGSSPTSSLGLKFNEPARVRYINKPADGGVTALHMAALNGHFDCMQLLIELGANVSAVTFPYGTTSNLIGAGSTPLHYAAGGGSLECCQVCYCHKGASYFWTSTISRLYLSHMY